MRRPSSGAQVPLLGVDTTFGTTPFTAEILSSRILYYDDTLQGIYSKNLFDGAPSVRLSSATQTVRASYANSFPPRSSDQKFVCYIYLDELFITHVLSGGPLLLSFPNTQAELSSVKFDPSGGRVFYGASNATADHDDYYVIHVDGTSRIHVGSFSPRATNVFSDAAWSVDGRWVMLRLFDQAETTTWILDSTGTSIPILLVGPSQQNFNAPIFALLGAQFFFMQGDTIYWCDLVVGPSSLRPVNEVSAESFAIVSSVGLVYFNQSGGDAYYLGAPSFVNVKLNGPAVVRNARLVPPGGSLVLLESVFGPNFAILVNFLTNSQIDVVTV